jgi:hypothetical protein
VVLLLYESKRRGWRNIALTLGITGTILFLVGLISGWLLNKATMPGGSINQGLTGGFQQTAIKGVNSLYGSIEQALVWFGVIYLILAIAILLVLHFTKPSLKSDIERLSPKL